jgi:hypothetical protein
VPDASVRYTVDPKTTRHLGVTSEGRHWLGVGLTGDTGLLTIGTDRLLHGGCASRATSRTDAVLSSGDPDGPMLTLMPDHSLPVGAWNQVGPNLFKSA